MAKRKFEVGDIVFVKKILGDDGKLGMDKYLYKIGRIEQIIYDTFPYIIDFSDGEPSPAFKAIELRLATKVDRLLYEKNS